jgi:hypothetical protein
MENWVIFCLAATMPHGRLNQPLIKLKKRSRACGRSIRAAAGTFRNIIRRDKGLGS